MSQTPLSGRFAHQRLVKMPPNRVTHAGYWRPHVPEPAEHDQLQRRHRCRRRGGTLGRRRRLLRRLPHRHHRHRHHPRRRFRLLRHVARRVRTVVGADGRRRHRPGRCSRWPVRLDHPRHHRVHRQRLDRVGPRQPTDRPLGDRRPRRAGLAAPRMERVLPLLRHPRRRSDGHDRHLRLRPAPQVRPQADHVGRDRSRRCRRARRCRPGRRRRQRPQHRP